jgi:hypothetical protein
VTAKSEDRAVRGHGRERRVPFRDELGGGVDLPECPAELAEERVGGFRVPGRMGYRAQVAGTEAGQGVVGEPAQVVVPAGPGYGFVVFGAELLDAGREVRVEHSGDGGLPRGRWVRRPLQEAAGQKSRVQFRCTPQACTGERR